MSTQTNELDDTEALDLLVGRLVRSESAVQTLGRFWLMQWVSQTSQVSSGGTPGTSAAGSNPGNAASVQAQTVVTSLAPTSSAQPSNAGGTGLQPGYMNMNQHPTIPPQGFNPQLFTNPTMWGAFPPPWAVPFQATQCQAPMPQAICTPAASTQINPDICPPSHSSTDYADMVDPFLSREGSTPI